MRRACLAVLIMLVLQYDIGVFLNLYVAIPASDKGAGLLHEIATAPFALSVHATLGLALIGVAGLLLARAAAVRDRVLMALASLALVAICGAFVAGETFVSGGGSASSSFAMAALTGVAVVCYVGTLMLTSLRRRSRIRESYDPDLSYGAEPGYGGAGPDSVYGPYTDYPYGPGQDPDYLPDSAYPSRPAYPRGADNSSEPEPRPWEPGGRPNPGPPPGYPTPRRLPRRPQQRPQQPRPPRSRPPSPLSESTLWEPAHREWPRPGGAWNRWPNDGPG